MPENIDRTSKAAWVTIAIALIGLLGTSIATYIQWESNLEIENKRLAAELELEQQRFRSQLILRAIDLESEKDRYTLLEFYDKANLVDGLKPFLDDYAKNGSSFIPRLSNTSSAIAPTSSLQSFLSIAATRDGRRPTADQRVEEAVRLAISGQPEDQARARQLLAEAGYPRGFRLELPIKLFEQSGGNRRDANALADSLSKIGIMVEMTR